MPTGTEWMRPRLSRVESVARWYSERNSRARSVSTSLRSCRRSGENGGLASETPPVGGSRPVRVECDGFDGDVPVWCRPARAGHRDADRARRCSTRHDLHEAAGRLVVAVGERVVDLDGVALAGLPAEV